MLNFARPTVSRNPSAAGLAITAVQRVMIVNGCFGIPELIDTILEVGHYDIVFVSSNEHAYSQIKRLQPDLVILCVRIDHLDGFQVLSMLKLDEQTRDIPVLTYTPASENDESDEDDAESADAELFAIKRMELMN